MKRVVVVGLTVAVILIPGLALATPQDQANDISDEIMSPFCPGVTLHECPSAKAIELRDQITGWFADGMSRAEVFERLEAEFGPTIRATPEPEGSGLAAWLLPALGVLVGIVVVTILLRRGSSAAPEQPSVTGDDRQRLEEELAIARSDR